MSCVPVTCMCARMCSMLRQGRYKLFTVMCTTRDDWACYQTRCIKGSYMINGLLNHRKIVVRLTMFIITITHWLLRVRPGIPRRDPRRSRLCNSSWLYRPRLKSADWQVQHHEAAGSKRSFHLTNSLLCLYCCQLFNRTGY